MPFALAEWLCGVGLPCAVLCQEKACDAAAEHKLLPSKRLASGFYFDGYVYRECVKKLPLLTHALYSVVSPNSKQEERALETVQLILQRNADTNCPASDGLRPLHYASTPALVTALVDSKANVNLLDHWGNSPLVNAMQRGNEELVRTMLQLGADPLMLTAPTCLPSFLNSACTSIVAAALRTRLRDIVRAILFAGPAGIVIDYTVSFADANAMLGQ